MGISWTKTVLIKLKSLSKQMQSFHVDSGNDPSVDHLVGTQKQAIAESSSRALWRISS
jgi:hypothetical protein